MPSTPANPLYPHKKLCFALGLRPMLVCFINKNKAVIMNNLSHPELDFAKLVKLAKENPEKFEQMRRDMIAQTISAAPKEMQHKLKQLQWKLDGIRSTAKTPLDASKTYNKMMLELVQAQRQLLYKVADICNNKETTNHKRQKATIIPIKHKESK